MNNTKGNQETNPFKMHHKNRNKFNKLNENYKTH